MRPGITFSSLLHIMVLLLVYFGVPSLFDSDEPVDRLIPVTVYPVRDETVLPPPQAPVDEPEAEAEPEPEPAPEKEAVPMPPSPDVSHDAPPPPEPDAAPHEPLPKVAEAAPPPPSPPTIPETSVAPPPPPPKPIQTAAVKPKPTPDVTPEEKPSPANSMDSLLKSLIEHAQTTIKLEQKQLAAATVEMPEVVSTMSRLTSQPLSSSVSDAIRRQVEDNWNVPAGAAGAGDMAVEIRIVLLPDGKVRRADIIDQARLTKDFFYRAMAESARRAVMQASPLRGLPPDKYEQWREITFTFRPPV